MTFRHQEVDVIIFISWRVLHWPYFMYIINNHR